VERQLLSLYCEREQEDQFLYSADEIAEMCGIDPKTARRLLRELTVPLIERWLLEAKP